jgi:hypothetical protein
MSEELLAQLSGAQKTLEPRLKALSNASGALKQALKVANE